MVIGSGVLLPGVAKIPLFLYLAHWLIQQVWATAQPVISIMAAAAILDFTAFRYSDFGRFLVCYSPHKTVPETVEKPFLAIFLG